MKLSREKIMREAERFLKRTEQYQERKRSGEDENFQVEFVLAKEGRTQPEDIIAYAAYEDNVICFYPFRKKKTAINYWAFDFDNDLFGYLEKGYEIMGMCHAWDWLIMMGKYVAKLSDKIPNNTVAVMVHWFLFLAVVGGGIVGTGFVIFLGVAKLKKVYQENCWNIISVMFAVISLAVMIYFGDRIRDIVTLNFMVILLLAQAVYVGIRWYVKGCKRARGYY